VFSLVTGLINPWSRLLSQRDSTMEVVSGTVPVPCVRNHASRSLTLIGMDEEGLGWAKLSKDPWGPLQIAYVAPRPCLFASFLSFRSLALSAFLRR